MRRFYAIIFGVIILSGCQTIPRSKTETAQEAHDALITATEAVIGKELSKEDAQEFQHQLLTDKEAQSAVETLTNTMGGKVTIKYCPIDGERFSATLERCPTHNVELKDVEP